MEAGRDPELAGAELGVAGLPWALGPSSRGLLSLASVSRVGTNSRPLPQGEEDREELRRLTRSCRKHSVSGYCVCSWPWGHSTGQPGALWSAMVPRRKPGENT